MELCHSSLFYVLVTGYLQTTFSTYSGSSRDEPFFPRHWSFTSDNFGYPEQPYVLWRRKIPSSQPRFHIPNVQDSVRSLQDLIDPAIRDYATSHIVDMKFDVIKYLEDKMTLPKQSKMSLSMISPYDTVKFTEETGKGTFTLANYSTFRNSQRSGFNSSFGVTRLFPFTQDATGSDICPEDTKETYTKECTLVGNGSVECEWKLGLEDSLRDRAYATLQFKIAYEISSDSECIREKGYTTSVVHVNMIDNSLNRRVDSKVNSRSFTVLEIFPRIDIEARVIGTNPAGITNCSSSCTKPSCKCEVKLFNDPKVYQKLLQMVHMGLSLVADGKISDDTSYRPDRKRSYQDFLLYWNELSSLDLSDLSLRNFNNDYLTKVKDITNLNFGNTGILEIPQGLRDLGKLKMLNLSGNVDLLPPNKLAKILEPLKQIQELDLSHLPLQSLDDLRECFISMKLQGLYLRNCSITAVNKNLFPPELVNLDLSENPLGNIPQDLLVHFPKLKSLGLSSIKLQSGDISLGEVSLEKLDLSYNNIVTIDNIIQSGFIGDLNLKGNQIQEWYGEDIFLQGGKPRVLKINLAENKIAVITGDMGKSLELLDEIELADNPFDCINCRVYQEMRQWLLSAKGNLKITTKGKESQLLCGSPPELVGYPIILVNSDKICLGLYLEWLWVMVIPFLILFALMVVYCVFKRKFRLQINHMEYLEEMKKVNRRRAAALSEKHFEYDVYLVFCPEEADFANYLKVRLEKARYRVLVSKNDFDAVSDEVLMSRHVVAVITNNIKKSEIAKRGVERTNFWMLSGDFHNIVMLMMEGVNEDKLSGMIKLLKSQHDCIQWRTSQGEDEGQFKKLLNYLGPSNYETWQKALHQQLEEDIPSTSSKLLPQKMHDIFRKISRKEKKDVEQQISSLL